MELTIEAQLKEKMVYADRLKMLFEEMNESSDGLGEGLTPAQIDYQLAQPKVQSWFKAGLEIAEGRPGSRPRPGWGGP